MESERKAVGWLSGDIKTPPFSSAARIDAGTLLARLQRGEVLSMPHSRPMPTIGARCHELRIKDAGGEWRIIYRTDADAILILAVFQKKTRTTPDEILDNCKRLLRRYDAKSRR